MLESALRAYPRNPVLHAELADVLVHLNKHAEASAHFEAALALEPHLIFVHLQYAKLLTAIGRLPEAVTHIQAAYKPVNRHVNPYSGDGTPLRVLQIGSALVDGLTATDGFLDPSLFETTTIAVQYWNRRQALPPHDIVFNSIADPDLCGPALDVTDWILSQTTAPIVNTVERVRSTGRLQNAERLRSIAGIVTPRMAVVPRDDLNDVTVRTALGFDFPFLVRAPGHHNGKHFAMIESESDLHEGLAAMPGSELLVMQFIDTRGSDGKFRKYRAMFVDGEVYPAHLAVSANWKVHYFSAQMGEAERAEEELFLTDMRAALGERAVSALETIANALDLDYAGIDFGLDRDGNAVVFEANAAMTLFLPPSAPETNYRRTAAQRIFSQAQRMMLRKLRCGAGTVP